MSIDIVSITKVSSNLIKDFANRTWGRAKAKQILSEWWIDSTHAETMVALDNSMKRVAGIVVGVKSTWRLPSGAFSETISICGWYVAPEYAGQGMGRILVNHFDKSTTSRNTLAITKNAIKAFKKLGWVGPFTADLFILPFPSLRSNKLVSNKFSYKYYKISGANLPTDLSHDLNMIENNAPIGIGRRVRSAEAWISHLNVWPKRKRIIYIILLHGKPVGAFSIRNTDKHAAPLYRFTRLEYVTDIILNNEDSDSLNYICSVIESATRRTTFGIIMCTSNYNISKTLVKRGWWSKKSRIIGKKIEAKSPLFMLHGDITEIPKTDLDMTFSDSDIDLNL